MGRTKKENTTDKSAILLDENGQKYVHFFSIYQKCMDYIEHLISEDEFHSYLNDVLVVKKYLPLSIKSSLVSIFYSIHENINEDDFVDTTYKFEIYSILFMLFAYTNINITEEEISENNYDVIMQSGLASYIKNQCLEDYNILYNMIFNSISFRNSQIIKMFEDNFNIDDIKDLNKDVQSALSQVDIEKLSLIKSIVDFNNPSYEKINKILYQAEENFNSKE